MHKHKLLQGDRVPDQPCIQALLVVRWIPWSVQSKNMGPIAKWLKLLKLWSTEGRGEFTFLPTKKTPLQVHFYVGTMIEPPPSWRCVAMAVLEGQISEKKNYMSSRKTIRTIRRSTMPLAGFFCIHMCTNTPSFAEGDVLGGAGIYPAPCWWEWWHNSRDWLAPEVVIFQVSKIGDVTHSSMNQIFKNLLRNCHLHPWKLGVPMVDSPKQWTFSMNNKFLLQMFLEQITTSDQSPQIGVRWIACVFFDVLEGFLKPNEDEKMMKSTILYNKKLPFF